MSKNGKARRRLSAEEKLKILEEARQPNTTGRRGPPAPSARCDDVLSLGA
jgi:hypothetical protein